MDIKTIINKWFASSKLVSEPKSPEVPIKMTEVYLKALFSKSADIKIENYQYTGIHSSLRLLLIYCEGMADANQLYQFILPRLEQMAKEGDIRSDQTIFSTLHLQKIEVRSGMKSLISKVYEGHLVIFIENDELLYSLNIANPPHREPNESNTETSIKGPKDGFTEELATNVALVRKRLRTNSLCYEQFVIGKRSQSKVALLYIDDIMRQEIIEVARKRLQHIDIDAIFSSAQLEEALSDSSNSLFPLLDYTGRPDHVANSLIHGRFAIIVDGAPSAVIGPANFTLLLKSPEDSYSPFQYVILERLLRLAGFMLAIFLPGFWVSLTSYHMDQLPFPLMATVTLSRIGLPLSTPLEAFVMLGLFELFREAGVRLPKAVGQTVTVVGGLIIGDAAIRAGLASSTMLVVASTAAVANFTLVNQSLSGTVTIIRLYVLLCSSLLGLFGFFLSMFSVVLYLSQLKSFGLPYLAPLSPLNPKDFLSGLIKKPLDKANMRPKMLKIKDPSRQGGTES